MTLRCRERNYFDGYYRYVFVCDKCGVEFVDYLVIGEESD